MVQVVELGHLAPDGVELAELWTSSKKGRPFLVRPPSRRMEGDLLYSVSLLDRKQRDPG
jgi:hypothetical protein